MIEAQARAKELFVQGVGEVARAGQELVRDVEDAITVDGSTGEVQFNGDGFSRFVQALSPDGARLAEAAQELLSHGFADPAEARIPFFALADVSITRHFPAAYWSGLGVPEGTVTSGNVLDGLERAYGDLPRALFTPQVLRETANVVTQAALSDSLQQVVAQASINDRSRPLEAELANATGLASIYPMPAAAASAQPAAAGVGVSQYVSGAFQLPKPADVVGGLGCLFNASWDVKWYGMIEICMDRSCTDKFQELLSTVGLGNLMAGIGNFVAAGLKAAIKSFGGWVAIIIAAVATYWWLMIELNKTSNGVCIYHKAPWAFWIPYPGHAVGR